MQTLPLKQDSFAGCKRVAKYIRQVVQPHLTWTLLNGIQLEAKRNSPFISIEFHLNFYPLVAEYYDAWLSQALQRYGHNLISSDQLRKVTDEWIKAHTIIWAEGIPEWQVYKLESFKQTRLHLMQSPQYLEVNQKHSQQTRLFSEGHPVLGPS